MFHPRSCGHFNRLDSNYTANAGWGANIIHVILYDITHANNLLNIVLSTLWINYLSTNECNKCIRYYTFLEWLKCWISNWICNSMLFIGFCCNYESISRIMSFNSTIVNINLAHHLRTGCSWNILFYPQNVVIFLNSASSAAVSVPGVVHTLTPRENRERPESGIFQNFKKNHNI